MPTKPLKIAGSAEAGFREAFAAGAELQGSLQADSPLLAHLNGSGLNATLPKNGHSGAAAVQLSKVQALFTRQFLAIEFDHLLMKFIFVDSKNERSFVRSLKVKLLSSDQEEEAVKVLQEHLQSLGFRRRTHVTISIPRHTVHTKMIKLPSQDEHELRRMVSLFIQKEIPLMPQEMVWNFRVLGTDDEGFSRVMVVMARRGQIERYLRICKQAGLLVDAVHLNTEAMYRGFLQTVRDIQGLHADCLALVDVDFASTSILVIHREKLLLCRSIRRGIDSLIDNVVHRQNIAEYEHWIDRLSQDVLETLAVFKQDQENPDIDRIALTGWLPRMKPFMMQLQDNLGIPVSWFDPTVSLRPFIELETENVQHQWFSMLCLLGMAVAKPKTLLDLRPVEERQQEKLRTLKRKIYSASLLAIYMLLLAFGGVKFALHQRVRLIRHFQNEIHALQPKIASTRNQQRLQRAVEKNLGSPQATNEFLLQVFRNFPRGVELASLTFLRGDYIIFRGTASSMQEVLNLSQKLGQQPLFHEVMITSMNRRTRQAKGQKIDFEMKIQFGKTRISRD